MGGCAPILRRLRVDEIADSGQTYGGHAYHDCLDTARADRVPIVHPRAGDVWRTSDGVVLTFIGPSLPFIRGKNAINDNSIAFVLQYRSFRMLFTGDAGIAAERRFLSEGVDLSASVLKVGHHGSAYSSSREFIAVVHPRYAIISVGRHNMFGHPAASTIETLQRFGAIAYRTDENGAVAIVSDGLSESLSCALSRAYFARPQSLYQRSLDASASVLRCARIEHGAAARTDELQPARRISGERFVLLVDPFRIARWLVNRGAAKALGLRPLAHATAASRRTP